MGKILVPKDTPDWQQLLSDTESARDSAQSARDGAVTARDDAQLARDDAQNAADDLGALGGIDGTVQTTSDLPAASNNTDEFWYVVDEAAYYKSDGSSWNKTSINLAGLDQTQKWTAKQNFKDLATKSGPFYDVTHSDYGGGLSNDGSAIQAALNEAGSSVHSTVLIPSVGGEWVIDSSVLPLKIPSKTTLIIEADLKIGGGSDTPLFVNESSTLDRSANSTVDQNIEIIGRGASLNGNKANVTANSSTVLFNSPIVFDEVEDTYVRGIHSFDSLGHGIGYYGGKDHKAEFNFVDNVDISGFNVEWKDISGGNIDRVRLAYNLVNDSGGVNNGSDYHISGAERAVLMGNISRLSVNNGIKVQGSADESNTGEIRDVIVVGNIIDKLRSNSGGNPADGIRIREQPSSGQSALRNVVCANNVVKGENNTEDMSRGIYVSSQSTKDSMETIIVSNNVVAQLTNDTAAIQVVGNNNVLRNLSLNHNNIRVCDGYGISLRNASDVQINGGVIKNAGNVQISIQNGTSEGIVIQGVVFKTSTTAIRSTNDPNIVKVDGCIFANGSNPAYTAVNAGRIQSFVNNDLQRNSASTVFNGTFPTVEYIAGNKGLKQIDAGQATVLSGNNDVDVSYDLGYDANLQPQDVLITPAEAWNEVNSYWVQSAGSGSFKLRVQTTPSADITFNYKIIHQRISS